MPALTTAEFQEFVGGIPAVKQHVYGKSGWQPLLQISQDGPHNAILAVKR